MRPLLELLALLHGLSRFASMKCSAQSALVPVDMKCRRSQTASGFQVEQERRPHSATLGTGNLELVLSTPYGAHGGRRSFQSLFTFMYFRSRTRRFFPPQFDLIVSNGGTDESF